MAVAAPVKLSKDLVAEFLALEAERRALEQQARAIGSRTKPIADALKETLETTGKTSIVRFGHRLTFMEGRPVVSWKDEFVRVAGPAEADRLLTAAPRARQLDVQPAKPAKEE